MYEIVFNLSKKWHQNSHKSGGADTVEQMRFYWSNKIFTDVIFQIQTVHVIHLTLLQRKKELQSVL